MPGGEEQEAPPRTLRRYDLKPRKRLGQNFLRDRTVVPKIVGAAELVPGDTVVEVGAGTGVLTRELLEHARRVVAVELDDALFDVLQQELGHLAHLTLWHGNALNFDPGQLLDSSYKLIGNIPYYITGPIVRHFLETQCQPEVMVLMVQKEVALRMTAAPGKLSLLGVSVQYYAHSEIIAQVPAGAFFPRPKVDSAIVRLRPYRCTNAEVEHDRFFTVVRAGFSAPRKQLGNTLSTGLPLPRETVREVLTQVGIGETRRAETVSVEEWECLTGILQPYLDHEEKN